MLVRPITPDDRDALAAAFERLSDRSRLQRFLSPKRTLTARELTYFTEIDHVTHEALGAFEGDDLIGVARYATAPGQRYVADVAFAVVDDRQRRGIGTILLFELLALAERNGIDRFTATTFDDNLGARRLLRNAGFRTTSLGSGLVDLALDLQQAEQAAAA